MVSYTPVNHDPFATNKSRIPAANSLAAAGRNGDTLLIHATAGDIGIPAEYRNSDVDAKLKDILGDKFDQYTAGSPANSRNPQTNLIEFEGTGGEGSGEGPGSEGGTGGNGPGGGGTGGPGNGAGAGDSGGPGDAPGTGADSPAPGAPAGAGTTPGIGGSGVSTGAADNPTGTESETAINSVTDPALSNTVSVTGLPGLVNDIENAVQSKVTAFANDPFGVTAAVLGNIALGVVTGSVSTAVNAGLAVTGHQSLGEMAVNGVRGAIDGLGNTSTSTSAPADGTTTGGLSLGGLGSPGGSGGNEEDNTNNELLKQFYQSLQPQTQVPTIAKSGNPTVVDIGKLAGLPDQSPSFGTNTKTYL